MITPWRNTVDPGLLRDEWITTQFALSAALELTAEQIMLLTALAGEQHLL